MSASEPPRPNRAAAGGASDDELALAEVCALDNTGIVAVAGPLDEVAEQAHRSILHALADDFSAVLCDLSGVTGFPAPEATALLASVGSEVRQWPGTPVGLVCPAVRLRQSLGRHPDSRYLVLAERRRQALAALARQPRATIVRASLPPVARSARAARDLVARTLLDWGWGPQIGSATLVVSELVTHAMLDADSELWVTISRCGSQLRLAVRDTNRTSPRSGAGPCAPHPPRAHARGRGLGVVGRAADPRRRQGGVGRAVGQPVIRARPPARGGRGRCRGALPPDASPAAGALPSSTVTAPTTPRVQRVLTTAEWMRRSAASADLLSEPERLRAQRSRREDDRLDFIAAHLLAREASRSCWGWRPLGCLAQSCPDCGADDHGPPRVSVPGDAVSSPAGPTVRAGSARSPRWPRWASTSSASPAAGASPRPRCTCSRRGSWRRCVTPRIHGSRSCTGGPARRHW